MTTKTFDRAFVKACIPLGLFVSIAVSADKPADQKVQLTLQGSASAQGTVSDALCPEDEIAVHSLLAKEITDKTFRIDENGEVNFPLLGRIHIAGNTVRQVEVLLTTKLKTYYVNPDVAVNIAGTHAEAVSVIGAVGAPGVHQIHGKVTLLDVLSVAGGVKPEAGPVVKITRDKEYGPIPHPSVRESPNGTSMAEVNLKGLLEERDPTENIVVEPRDVISVPLAEVVYVVGSVKRAGGFPLGGKPDLSVLQAIALAEGLDVRAAPKAARILRRGSGENAEETDFPVNVEKILHGKERDVLLHPNDILFIPNSAAKSAAARAVEAAIQMGTMLALHF